MEGEGWVGLGKEGGGEGLGDAGGERRLGECRFEH